MRKFFTSSYKMPRSTDFCLLLLPVVLATTRTYQGTVLGHDQRCQSLCLTVCDTAECISTCNERFCAFEESAESTWVYVAVMLAVVAVLALALRWVLRKMLVGREMGGEEQTARFYHSL